MGEKRKRNCDLPRKSVAQKRTSRADVTQPMSQSDGSGKKDEFSHHRHRGRHDWLRNHGGDSDGKLDISGVAIPSKVNDAYFKRTKVAKKSEEGIFEQTQAKYSASEERKADQKAVDAAVLTAVNKEKYMKGYLKKDFGLSKGQYPHKMCW